jgi:quercetin dioxygenase-like cupin family protein
VAQTIDNTLLTPAGIEWQPGPAILPDDAQAAILYGDPTKDGLFSMRFKLPKGYRVPPHTLSKAGLFTVISGTFRIGMGETTDPSKARAMPAGSFIALAPDTPHFVSGRGDGRSAQQYWPVGDHLHRPEGRPATEAEVTHGRRSEAPKHDPEKCAAVFGKDHAQTRSAGALCGHSAPADERMRSLVFIALLEDK